MDQMDSPLKWHGGKSYLARKIVAMMPPHLHYVETHGGSLAVLLERDPLRNWMSADPKVKLPNSEQGCSEVVNDLHRNLMAFWRTLQDERSFAEFRRFIDATPFSEASFQEARVVLMRPEAELTSMGKAYYFFVHARQSRAGCFKDFATLSRNRTRRGMSEQASAWLTVIDKLPEVHARLKRVVILNRDAVDVISQQDGPKTLFYLDPPYLHETRASVGQYAHEMTAEQHWKLLDSLGEIEGKFMLSGYRSQLYDDFAKAHTWRRADFKIPNSASGGKTKKIETECVWMNFDPPAGNGATVKCAL